MMPVAKKKTIRAHPPTKSTGKRQPTGTTHFQFRPNQFGCGMGGGGEAGSIIQTTIITGIRKSESELTIILHRPKPPITNHYSLFHRGSDCSALAKA
jgi:hypothetical protein